MNTKEIIDRIFKDPGTKHDLTEFENLGKPIHDVLSINSQAATAGRDPVPSSLSKRRCEHER